ncbi:hypothetical protein SCLCIDRAFT_34757 [Scleroderma citrinum Foug A]|uniref:Uncharacterized protein n=1 Tax=Scleroderma citrinum Foug A TaxID=1036808 RepID=A0A0C3CMW5_9AGAM|nr:hypothetical protein SCLCIDRAFT_34757 [Scleroderma citrinum Foug A]
MGTKKVLACSRKGHSRPAGLWEHSAAGFADKEASLSLPTFTQFFRPSLRRVATSSHARPGRAAVGVAVKPPDESFRRLETARPNSPIYLSQCVLYAALTLGGGRPTGTTNRLTARDTSFRT